MTTQAITITTSIPLPKTAREQWKNQSALMEVFDNTIIVKRIEPPAWDVLIPQMRRAGKRVSPKTVREAVAWARRNA